MKWHISKDGAAGFTLVELMVAIVVLAIGLLGIAKMSLGTVQANGSAFMRSQATQLIQQVVDDMRANQPAAAAGSYNLALGANPGAAPNCVTAVCTAQQIATFDLARWYTQLGASLPGGRGSVAVVQATNPTTGSLENTAVIVINWNDTVAQTTFANGSAVPGTPMAVTMETLL
jgi:type IV pilus assembly protein PilV